MSDALTNAQIALLCDIEEFHPSKATAENREDLNRLLTEGYLEQTSSDPKPIFKLTAKAMDYLSKHGVGLNEG